MTGSHEPLTRTARPVVTVLTVTLGLQCLRVLLPVAPAHPDAHGVLGRPGDDLAHDPVVKTVRPR